MKIQTKNSLMESQEMMREVLAEAMGIYMAKEPKAYDSWRNTNLWNLWEHFRHELEEMDRSTSFDRVYHNLLDGIALLAMLAVRVREEEKKQRLNTT